MLRLIFCEFWKLKRRKLLFFAFLTSLALPALFALVLPNKSLDNFMGVSRQENGFLLLIPLTVVIAANLFFQEQDLDTLKNLLCIPVTRAQLAVAKVFVLLAFDVAYELAGYAIGLLMAAICGASLEGWGQQLFLNVCAGALLWAAALPGVLLTVWVNKSYIISVILAFGYAVLGYIMQISDACVRVPLGLNVQTFLPVPLMLRWLYQYNTFEAGSMVAEYYEGFRPYFVSTPTIFAILMGEALVCVAAIIKTYQRQSV